MPCKYNFIGPLFIELISIIVLGLVLYALYVYIFWSYFYIPYKYNFIGARTLGSTEVVP